VNQRKFSWAFESKRPADFQAATGFAWQQKNYNSKQGRANVIVNKYIDQYRVRFAQL
jgi:hypothetical protein